MTKLLPAEETLSFLRWNQSCRTSTVYVGLQPQREIISATSALSIKCFAKTEAVVMKILNIWNKKRVELIWRTTGLFCCCCFLSRQFLFLSSSLQSSTLFLYYIIRLRFSDGTDYSITADGTKPPRHMSAPLSILLVSLANFKMSAWSDKEKWRNVHKVQVQDLQQIIPLQIISKNHPFTCQRCLETIYGHRNKKTKKKNYS